MATSNRTAVEILFVALGNVKMGASWLALKRKNKIKKNIKNGGAMNPLIEALDNLGYAQNRMSFIRTMFTSAKPQELEFDESGLAGFCRIIRGIEELIDTASEHLDCLRAYRSAPLSSILRKGFAEIGGLKDSGNKVIEIDRNLKRIELYLADIQTVAEWGKRFSQLREDVIGDINPARKNEVPADSVDSAAAPAA